MLFKEKFEKYHADNPHLYTLFERYAIEAVVAGASRISARLISERIRWECVLERRTIGDRYKINDHYTPCYARMFMEKYPAYNTLFRMKKERIYA